VGDQQRGDAQALEHRAQVVAQAPAQVGVEAGEGFVEQQQVGARCQRAGQRDALLLAAGEFVRIAIGQAVEADQRQRLKHARRARAAVQAVQAESDVVGDRKVGEQRQVLEHEAQAALLRRQRQRIAAAQPKLAGIGGVEAGDGAQQGGLAAAAGAQQAAQFPGLQRQPQPAHGRLSRMTAGQPVDREQGRARHQAMLPSTKSQFTRLQNASTYFGRAFR